MKKNVFLFLAFGMILSQADAQTINDKKYRRSSIYSIMIKSDVIRQEIDQEVESNNEITSIMTKKVANSTDVGSKYEQLLNFFPTLPISDQFDDLNLPERYINIDSYILSADKINAAKKETGGNKTSWLSRLDDHNPVLSKVPACIKKFFSDKNVAARLIGRWYNYNDKTFYNTDLIRQRGLYSATEEDKDKAKTTVRGNVLLEDDGENLLNQTYVLVNVLEYRKNEALAAQIQKYADVIGQVASCSLIQMAASKALGAATSGIIGKGYSITTTTFLYKLKWDKERMAKFYAEYWDKSINDLIASGMCELEFVGKDKGRAGVRVNLGSKVTGSELVKRATVRAIDEAIAKLQENYEDFRTITPISRIDLNEKLLYARIGLKEGIKAGDVFEVLEPTMDKETNTIFYKKVGTVKAVKNKIWDNRAGAAEELAEDLNSNDADVKAAAESQQSLESTAFSGKVKEGYEGYLLRLKDKK